MIDIDMIWVPKINNQRHTAGYRPYMNGVDFVSPMIRDYLPRESINRTPYSCP